MIIKIPLGSLFNLRIEPHPPKSWSVKVGAGFCPRLMSNLKSQSAFSHRNQYLLRHMPNLKLQSALIAAGINRFLGKFHPKK
jgi:hypothetical protein